MEVRQAVINFVKTLSQNEKAKILEMLNHGIICGAKKYLQKYLDTMDVSFREMAKDELRHGSILLKKANARLVSGDEKKKLKGYESEIAEISAQIESA